MQQEDEIDAHLQQVCCSESPHQTLELIGIHRKEVMSTDDTFDLREENIWKITHLDGNRICRNTIFCSVWIYTPLIPDSRPIVK